MTGFEYSAAVLMIYAGLVAQGLECIGNIRARYDGEKRNPWDEAECGHHYARAMASWSAIPALSGFHYDGPNRVVTAVPRLPERPFRSFWASASAWGTFSLLPAFELHVLHGTLPCRSIEIEGTGSRALVTLDGKAVPCRVEHRAHATIVCQSDLSLREGQTLRAELRS